MSRKVLLLLPALLALALLSRPAAPAQPPQENFVDYVNPFIGVGEDGRTFPAVSLPFGFTQWTPQSPRETGRAEIPYWGEENITGFRGSHAPQGSWMLDYGCLTIQPQAGALRLTPAERSVRMENAEAHPDYWSCVLADNFKLRVEITATMHCAIFRITSLGSGDVHILVDAHEGGETFVVAENREILVHNVQHGYGSSIEGFHVVRFEKPFLQSSGASGGIAHADYSVQAGDVILLKVGTSFISYEQARTNLALEIPGWDFENVRRAAREIWNRELGRIEVEGGTENDLIKFYTALYHCLLEPSQLSEYGKYYSAFDNAVHECPWGEYYNDFSLWDTFRAEHSLLILLKPEEAEDMCQSLVRMGLEGGWIPKWPNPGYSGVMIATHSDSVIAETYLKGLVGFDVESAYELSRKHATHPGPVFYEGREGVEYYMELGYVPANIVDQATSITLESAYDDYALAMLARALGREDDYEYFMERSGYWRNVYDPNAPGEPGNPYRGYVRGRNLDGSWANPTDFSPTQWYSYITEGTPFQYTWHVMHDVEGMIEAMGGREAFNRKLDWFFDHSKWTVGNDWSDYYWHGNEPCQHVAYLYDWSGKPWKTQEIVRRIAETRYWTVSGRTGGLCGNEDCGQTSAWFVFSAMGFYPVCPVGLHYEIGSPLFSRIVLHLPDFHYGGRDFTIIAHGNSKENVYIQSAKLNGKPLNRAWLWHWEIAMGGTLELWMGPEPNTEWGADPSDAPPSGDYLPWTPLEYESVIAPENVAIGESFRVTVRVSNPAPGTVVGYVELSVDGENLIKPVVAPGGGGSEVSFELALWKVGQHEISAGGIRRAVGVREAPFTLRFPPWGNLARTLREENGKLEVAPLPSQAVPDLSGRGSSGTLGLSPSAEPEDPKLVRDGDGWAFWFDGVNDILIVPPSASLNLGSEFTISVWIWYVHTPGIHRLVSRWGANQDQKSYQLWIAGSGWGGPKDEVILETRDGGTVNTGYVIPSEEWHHLVWVHSRSGGFDRLFVDGVLVFQRSAVADPPASNQPLGIGGQPGVEQGRRFCLRGMVKDVRVYSRALSPSEVQQLFGGGLFDDASLVGWWSAGNPGCFAGSSGAWSRTFDFGFPVKLTSLRYDAAVSENENAFITVTLDNRSFGPAALSGSGSVTVENIFGSRALLTLQLSTPNSMRSPQISGLLLSFEPAYSKFVVENLLVEPREVLPGGAVTVSVDAANAGDLPGACRLELVLDGSPICSEEVFLQPGQSRRITFTLSSGEPGLHTIRIGDLIGEFRVVPLQARFEVLEISAPQRVKKGEEFSVSVKIINLGNAAGSGEIVLRIDGESADNKLIRLEPLENITVVFRIKIGEVGTHTLSVDNLSAEVSVYEEGLPATVIFAVIAIACALAAAGLKIAAGR